MSSLRLRARSISFLSPFVLPLCPFVLACSPASQLEPHSLTHLTSPQFPISPSSLSAAHCKKKTTRTPTPPPSSLPILKSPPPHVSLAGLFITLPFCTKTCAPQLARTGVVFSAQKSLALLSLRCSNSLTLCPPASTARSSSSTTASTPYPGSSIKTRFVLLTPLPPPPANQSPSTRCRRKEPASSPPRPRRRRRVCVPPSIIKMRAKIKECQKTKK